MDTLNPGLYLIEEKGETPIIGASTSVVGLVGVTERGPIGRSLHVTSWNDFVAKYGGYLPESYLAYAVRGFFENGGTQLYISRAVHYSGDTNTAQKATGEIKNADNEVAAVFDALDHGSFGNTLVVEIKDYKETDKSFTVTVSKSGMQMEKFENVSLGSIEQDINNISKYVSVIVWDEDSTIAGQSVTLSGGLDGSTGMVATDYVGNSVHGTGVYAFDNDPVNIIAIPGQTDAAVVSGLVTYVENRKDAFAIVETPMVYSPQEAKDYVLKDLNVSSERLAVYYGWLNVSDSIGVGKNPTKIVPPSGHIAGIYARTDAERGVWKAPAGTEAVVRGIIGLNYSVNDAEQGLLNPFGINAIRSFPGEGTIVWGTRTQSTEMLYVPNRRTLDFIETSIMASTRWSVFEPNDAELWDKLRTTIEGFLRDFWSQGGLKGNTEADAFFVQVDETTTTPEDVDTGRVYANLGVALRKPAEFVIFRVSLRN